MTHNLQPEIMNLRIFMLCVKIRKCEIFSIRSNSAMRTEKESFVKDNFFDRRNSTNLSLARSKMAKRTYFLRDCAIGFGWGFHRPCKNLCLFTLFTNFMQYFLRASTILFAQLDYSRLELS